MACMTPTVVCPVPKPLLAPARERRYADLWRAIHERAAIIEVELTEAPGRSLVIDATRWPTQSHYVPVMLRLVEEAERAGRIAPSRTILVETSTGNAGAGIAYVARELGYSVVVFMPGELPVARVSAVRRYLPSDGLSGIVLTPGGRYVEGMVDALRTFLKQHPTGYRGHAIYVLNHSRRRASVEVMEEIAGGLIDRLGADTRIDVVVAALGNGTTAMGLGRAVRARNPAAWLVGVEPREAPWCFLQKYGEPAYRRRFGEAPRFRPHRLYGAGAWGVEFPNMDHDLIEEIYVLAEDDWRPVLARLHAAGYSVGHSSAACQAAVERIAKQRRRELTFLSMFYDPSDRY